MLLPLAPATLAGSRGHRCNYRRDSDWPQQMTARSPPLLSALEMPNFLYDVRFFIPTGRWGRSILRYYLVNLEYGAIYFYFDGTR